jgi:nitrite reductase/ring-hydroxylating ferredoxin subunit
MSLSRAKRQAKRKLVGKVGELAPGMTKKFALSNGKYSVEGMLLNYQGTLHAYVNRCPHIGISLDWVDNQFCTLDGRYLMCANHGATFEPATGECIWGRA